uniref:Peroxisomal membrane protein MPV17 n=1 Tax=Dunaliella tertiolecta TaxID=3047 RepID=A0A7S3VGX4_DUNTE|eukprot:CAMPEP_0202343310 /NCGR_PEP_ID=MMETSP1126-20121109/3486_1 /ASSEMBLY_ACC=CAM_ASM_000457 /TAXON_ID=3047 /ORGANISM="Dunaliella tertiolecta, Strain CCMP1320" /LENGTH=202 /DNA_ID=CAMNT_0048934361 /DNA_START=65 /DNA_END=673 /DNA_ORIENTATION=-
MQTLKLNGIRMWQSYERALHRRPVPTQMATSAVLWGAGDVLAQRVAEGKASKDIDKRRVGLTSVFGLSFMGPVGHYWYLGLDAMAHKYFAAGSSRLIATKVIVDSLILGPLYVIAFYAFGSAVIDRSGWQGFKHKIDKDFISTYLAELVIWPAFQTFNFVKVPVQHQLLAVNFMTLVDASFLSWARNQENWVSTVTKALSPK